MRKDYIPRFGAFFFFSFAWLLAKAFGLRSCAGFIMSDVQSNSRQEVPVSPPNAGLGRRADGGESTKSLQTPYAECDDPLLLMFQRSLAISVQILELVRGPDI